MTTLFAPEEKPARSHTSGQMVLLFALTGLIWFGLAIGNFHNGHHTARAWMQAIAGVLYLFVMVMHLSQWRRQRRAS